MSRSYQKHLLWGTQLALVNGAQPKQAYLVKSIANEVGQSPQERSALKKRLLYKLMGK